MKLFTYLLATLFSMAIFGNAQAAYELEPNNNNTQATPLTPDAGTIGQLSSSSDEDWFKIQSSGAGSITINFATPYCDNTKSMCSAATTWDVVIFDQSGNLLSRKTRYSISKYPSIEYTQYLSGQGTYYIKIVTPEYGLPSTSNYTLLVIGSIISIAGDAHGVIGTPNKEQTVSGVGVISGFHCQSNNIDVYLDDVYLGKAGAGTTLKGTLDVCGKTDTGFSLLYNFSNLTEGKHTVKAYADGVLFDSSGFYSIKSGGVSWLPDVTASFYLCDFPSAGKTAYIDWAQSYQNFLITEVIDSTQTNGLCAP